MTEQANIPDVVVEAMDPGERYNKEIELGDSAALNSVFWNSPFIVRFGLREHLFGYEEIANFRTGVWKRDAPRVVERLAVTTFGRDFGTANAMFGDTAGKVNRQSQVWLRTAEGLRIAAAHENPLPD